MDQLSNRGSVEDIKCTLRLMEANSIRDASVEIANLYNYLEYETRNKNRSSVVSAINSTIKRITKQFSV